MRGALVGALIVLLAVVGTSAAEVCTSDELQRVFDADTPSVHGYRALRHLEARNGRFDKTAWMDVWTDADRETGFRYKIAAMGGSHYIYSRVFIPALETEREMWATGAPERAAINLKNYMFASCNSDGGLSRITVTPRRKDVLLVEGAIFVRPESGDLVRVQGLLSKTPSVWTRRVEIVRHYERIGGVRMPTAFETLVSVLIAGQSTFKMTYEYETVNGQVVGHPVRSAVSP
jgi:hypothetical protein